MAKVWGSVGQMRNGAHPDARYALEMSSWLLYRLTGERYPGIEEGHQTYRLDDGACAGGGGKGGQRHLRLRQTPVHELLEVRVGEEGPDVRAEYLVERYTILRRHDGAALALREGLSVRYLHGMAPPAAGVHAATLLADQFVYAFTDSEECRLPERVTAISRQGVSYTVLDPQDYIRDGRTGIYAVDLFITAANPSRANLRARVFRPDAPRWSA